MNSLETIEEMRSSLTAMNERLTPYSGKREHQEYLEAIKHYKKILSAYISRLTDEIDKAIEKSIKNINSFTTPDNKLIANQVVNGRT